MFTFFGRLFVGVVLTSSLLSACTAGSPSSLPPPAAFDLSSPGRLQPDIRPFGKWMYLAQLYGEDLVIYQRQGLSLQYRETLTQGVASPQGSVATPNGWWYVANGRDVLVYRSTQAGPIAKQPLNDPGQFAVNVDVTPSRQLAAVSNGSSSSGGTGSVSVYVNRQQNPTRTLTYGTDPLQGTGVAIDHQGSCYWAFNDPNTNRGSIVKFSGCQGRGKLVVPSIGNAQGIVFDQSDDLYYIDQSAGSIYHCTKTAHCKPFQHRFDLPVNLNFDHKDKLLWLADAGGYIYAVNPQRGRVVFKMQIGGSTNPPFGIAPAPGG